MSIALDQKFINYRDCVILMPLKHSDEPRQDQRKDAIERMNEIITGLTKRFSSPEEFLEGDFLEMILEVNKQVLPDVKFERNWNDHFKFIEALVDANNKENAPYLQVKCRRLGNLGVLLVTEGSSQMKNRKKASNPRYHPFVLLLAANVKHQFRDLSITLKPTTWKLKTSESEMIMQ
jgi:hypothetical protein